MMRMLLALVTGFMVSTLIPSLIPSAHAEDSPESFIAGIYAAYQAASPNGPNIENVYSHHLQGLIAADAKETPDGEAGKLDFDVFVDGQDWQISDLKITTAAQTAEHADVKADFKNMGEPRELLFSMIREGDRWVINEIQSTRPTARWTMSKILTGDPGAFPDDAK